MKDENLPRLIVGDVLLLSLCPLQGNMAVEYGPAAQLPMLLLIPTDCMGDAAYLFVRRRYYENTAT